MEVMPEKYRDEMARRQRSEEVAAPEPQKPTSAAAPAPDMVPFTAKVNYVVDRCIDAEALWRQYEPYVPLDCTDLDLHDAVYTFGHTLKDVPEPEEVQHLYTRTDPSSNTIHFHRLEVVKGESIVVASAVMDRATGELTFAHKDAPLASLITQAIAVHWTLGREESPLTSIWHWHEVEGHARSVVVTEIGSDYHLAYEDLGPAPEPAPASAAQAATDGVAFSEQLVALHRRNAPEEEFLQAMLSEIQTNPAFALKDDLPADTTQLDVAKNMLPLLLEGCGIPYPKPAPKPRPKIERLKRQRTAPMNAEHRALLERVKLARAVAGNTRNKEPAPIVYILTHPREPDHVKIGVCQNVDARLSKYQTGCPHRAYEMRHMEYCADGRVVEEYIKLQQADAREGATEWYRLSVEQAWEIVKQAIIACAE